MILRRLKLLSILRRLKLLFNRQPSYVNIETSSICNRTCSYCPNAYFPRPDVKMDIADIEFILLILARHNYKGTMRFWGLNEPLMDDRICEIIFMSKRILPHCRVELSTNGDYLDTKWYRLLDIAGLDHLTVTRHSEMERREITWKYNNLTIVDRPRISRIYNRCGAVPFSCDGHQTGPCMWQDEININADGNMRFCCNDYGGSTGNALTSDPLKIWHDLRYWLKRIPPAFGFMTGICKRCRWLEKGGENMK